MSAEIEDCIIDGGYAADVPCPTDDEVCWYGALPDASAWNPKTLLSLSAETKSIEEMFTAVEGQQHFGIQTFTYARGTGALSVYKNGLLLVKNVEWVEQQPHMFSLVEPAKQGDVLVARGRVAITGDVDVRDTDIFINNYQGVRDYSGTETTIYAQGIAVPSDGGAKFFQKLTGYAAGHFVDDGVDILVPTGGDGSSAWVARSYVITVNTVEDMTNHPSLHIGDIVQTNGYFNPYDDGSNMYVIVSASTGTPDGGFYIDIPASNVQARAVFPGYTFNVKQWGAKGDGVTDDTAALQAAHNTMVLLGGGVLNFNIPSVAYKCNLLVSGQTYLKGVAKNVTLIPATDAPIISIRNIANASQVQIESLTLDGSATKATFTSQDGIRIDPNSGFQHDTISITNCVIKDSGAGGIVLFAGETSGTGDERIEQIRLADCEVSNCTLQGLRIRGNVGVVSVNNCEFADNGDETLDTTANIVIQQAGPTEGIPESINFIGCKISNENYALEGASVAIIGGVDITFFNCSWYEFFTGLVIRDGVNGNIAVRDCRFERDDVADIDACCNVETVNGFIWDHNNVSASTTGPVGLILDPTGSYSALKLEVNSNNSWGNLDASTTAFTPTTVTSGNANLRSRHGYNCLTLAADGTADLNNLRDEKGGTAQLVTGDVIHLGISAAARTVTVKHGTGNIKLAGGVDFPLNNVSDLLTLMWESRNSAWLEVSRSSNHV